MVKYSSFGRWKMASYQIGLRARKEEGGSLFDPFQYGRHLKKSDLHYLGMIH